MKQVTFNKAVFLVFALIFGFTASSVAFAQQYARPDSTIAAGGQWSPKNNPHLEVDEVSPDDGTTQIESGKTPNETIEFGLSDVTDPASSTGHVIRFRITKTTSNAIEGELRLLQGATQIATTGAQSITTAGVWQTFSHTLSAGEADAITDYTDLRLAVNPTGVSKAGQTNHFLEVTWMELEVPTFAATAPTVTVQAATSVGTRSATLNGTVTVNGSAADNDTYFKYGTSSGVYTVTTASAGTVTTGAFSLGVTGLEPSTTYYYIACATANEAGGLEGCSSPTEATFTTDPLVAPTVTVQAATAIGTNGATLHGTVTVNGTAADNDTYFKYGTSSGVYTVTTASAGTVTTGAFSLAVTGLDPSTTYYYIACATANESGGLEGCSSGEESFTTATPLTAPTVTVQAATSVNTRGATLNGTVTVNGSAADNDTYFKYGTSSGVYTVTTASAGTVTTGAFSLAVTGLDPNTTYYYIACATANEPGGLEGCSSPTEATFTTDPLVAPTVTVQAATAIGTNGATLHGTITVNGTAADNDTYFKYGTTSGVYTVTTASAGTVTTGAFSLAVTGLDPNTTYYYIACATANESGGLEGCSSGEQSFTTDKLAPTVTVQAATSIGSRTATLNGTVTVNGSAADNDTYFKYGTSSGVYTVTTASAGTVTTGAFSLGVTGLEPNTTYYYIACATANEAGGLEGCSSGEQTFTTDPLTAPTVTVQPATAIGAFGATLNGNVTVNGSAVDNDTYFKYGTSSGVYTITTASAGTVTTGVFSLAITGLDPSTTYYYIACATANETGGLEGCSSGEQSFTTTPDLTAPTVTVQAATAIGTNGATLHGNVTVNGSATDNDTYFKYGTTSGVYTVTTASAGTVTTGAFSLAVTGLNPNTTYYYIACATANEPGGLEGCSSGEQSFTTDKLAPTVTVQAATSIGSRTATLNGTVTVNGSAADNDTYFKYGTSSGVYTVTTASAGTVTTGAFSLGVTGLDPNTTYYYIACATANEAGGLEGCSSGEQSFTTNPLTAPTVTVQAATSIGSRTATLNGTITVNGSATDNNTYFEYGTSSGPPYDTTSSTVSTIASGSFALPITGLEPNTTYYYRACATANEVGGLTGCSTETSFATDPLTAPTVTVQPATAIGTVGATLNGNVTVNGSATDNDTYFKYGTSSGGPYDTTTTSAGTVTTGAFSKAVTGLDSDVTYYYLACATANETGGLEGCSSGEESFTTVASVSQPTNLWFHNIGSTSMTLFWTEGIGDGSIVVMKLGSAVNANPVDGTEHLADSIFGSGADLGGGNFVVYRGNGESVHVTGLAYPQTYHVAVFTYTGAGALIEYLLPNPAIGNETTVANTPHNVAVLNVDDTVTCTTGCHGGHGSALVPRGTDQETACVSCHNPASGVPGASALTNFSLHTNSRSMPPASPGVVDCGSCHELHNPGSDDTTYTQNPITSLWDYNLHYLRANPQKYVPTALPWPANNLVVHTDTNSEDWAFEDGAAYMGACQICHTETSGGYENTSGGDDTHQGGDLGNVNCRGCHNHGGSFAGAGGDCTACHNSVQDKDGAGGNPGRRIVTTEFSGGSIVSTHLPGTLDASDCEVCHNHDTGPAHQAGQVNLFNVDDNDPGTNNITLASYIDPRTNQAEAAKLTVFCLACHDADGADGDTTPFSTNNTVVNIATDWTNASHNPIGSVSCFGDGAFGCHGSGHGGQKLTILAPAESGPGTDNSDEREQFCFNCHDSDGPSTIDIDQYFGGAATNIRETTGLQYTTVNQRHDVLPADQLANFSGAVITCNDCHAPHLNNNSEPVTNPDTGASLATYSRNNSYSGDATGFAYAWDGSDYDPTNPEGGSSIPETDYVEFCLVCHDGTAPPGVTLPPVGNGMLNMADMYRANDQHGRLVGNGSASRGYMKQPWASSTNYNAGNQADQAYAALNCTLCHGAHGSGNIYNLRTSITVNGTVMTVGGKDAFMDPASCTKQCDSIDNALPEFGSSEYFLPVQEDMAWGAWCTFCHEPSHGTADGTGCQAGHRHGGGNF